MRLAGKGWEVRAKLRHMTKQVERETTLEQWLRHRNGASVRSGSGSHASPPSQRSLISTADFRHYPMV